MSSLFATLLGKALDGLPATLLRLHSRPGTQRYRGRASIVRGRGWLARFLALAARLPPIDGPVDLEVEIAADDGGETWTRNFAGRPMRSRLTASQGRLREKLGVATFFFALAAVDGRLTWRVVAVRALGIPLPAAWFAGVRATEFERDGHYHFDVEARLPGLGLLIHYQGALDDV